MSPIQDKVAALEAEARERAGLEDFGEAHYRSALTAWADDLLHAPLNDFSRGFFTRLAVRNLVMRLRAMDWLNRHPEIDEVQLPAVVMILSPPRTGTTLLHNLMNLHARGRTLLRWELMEPTPPPEAATYGSDPRIAKLQKSLEPLRGSLLEQMHWVNADEPDECPWGWIDCRGLLGQGCFASMPRWAEHLQAHDFRTTYREQRRLMKLRLWRNPPPAGSRLILKSPQSAVHPDAFMDAFPDATVVMPHRDPYRSLLSTLTVIDAINTPFCEGDHSYTRDGERDRKCLESLTAQLEAMMGLADRDDVHSIDVPYPELLEAPAAKVAELFAALGVEPDAALEEKIQAHLDAQKAGRRKRPPASYEDFGYSRESVHADPTVAAYMARFGVQPEATRMASTRGER